MKFSRLLRSTPAFAGVLVCALLTACATPQATQLRAQAPDLQVAPTAELRDVPFFAQKEYECGPAALAMVISAAGVAVTPEALVDQVYLPARKASLQVEMQAATRQRGLLAYPLKPQLQDLLQEVAAGHPVLVFENVSLPVYPIWHYAVVIAYDLGNNTITLHSGVTERMEMSLYTFERTWARGQYWAMLALPPGQLPVTAEVPMYLRSVAALEMLHADAAHTAYSAALVRWPQQPSLLLGLGNTAYAMHDLSGAASAYGQAVGVQPDFADAWNNLAQTQLELGHKEQARDAITHAVALGGARQAQYLELQAQIAKAMQE